VDNEVSGRIIQDFIGRVRQICPDDGSYPLHEPLIGEQEKEYLSKCIDSGWVSYLGPFVTEFEERLATITGLPYAVSVSSGTTALELVMRAIDVNSEDEVLVPSLTFAATAAAVYHAGGIPHFVDCEEESLGICPTLLNDYLDRIVVLKNGRCFNKISGHSLKAIICVHIFGHPCKAAEIKSIADKYNLHLIEDVAESLGSFANSLHTGRLGIAAALSFNGNKIVSTGGGGAVLTADKVIADRIRHISSTAKVSHPYRYIHDSIGFNYRLSNVSAALGCAQLNKLDQILAMKRSLAQKYQRLFEGCWYADFLREPLNCNSNYWLNTILLKREYSASLDDLVKACHQERIYARPAWNPLHQLDPYRGFPRSPLGNTESLVQRLISLPSSPKLALTQR
jgi:perosamine synthetase